MPTLPRNLALFAPRANAAPPKSSRTICGGVSSYQCRRSMMLSGFMSRCTTPTLCKKDVAPRS